VSSFALTEKERNALMEQVYGGYVRSPQMTRGNKATGGADRRHKNAGQINYYAYGGKPSSDYNDRQYAYFRDSKYYKPGAKNTVYEKYGHESQSRNRETWAKVANHLGIKKPDSEEDLRKMYDYVRGYQSQKEQEQETPTPTPPPPVESNTERPDEVKRDQQRFEETRLDRPENQMPRLEDAMRGTSDANMGAIRGGDDLNRWYQTKFVPHLEADAIATMSEQGDDARDLLKSFAFNPPKLGSIKELFDKYKGEIEDLD